MKLTDVELGVIRDHLHELAPVDVEQIPRLLETLDIVKADNVRLREALQAVLEDGNVEYVRNLVRRALAAT